MRFFFIAIMAAILGTNSQAAPEGCSDVHIIEIERVSTKILYEYERFSNPKAVAAIRLDSCNIDSDQNVTSAVVSIISSFGSSVWNSKVYCSEAILSFDGDYHSVVVSEVNRIGDTSLSCEINIFSDEFIHFDTIKAALMMD
jgi:hypothetical protein